MYVMDNSEQTSVLATDLEKCCKEVLIERIILDRRLSSELVSSLQQQLAVSQAANKIADSKERQIRLEETSALNNELQSIIAENNKLKTQLYILVQSQSPVLEKKLGTAKADVSILHDQLRASNDECSTLTDRVDALKGIVAKLRKDLEETSVKLKHTTDIAQNFERQATELRQIDTTIRSRLEKQIETLMALHDKDQLLIQHYQREAHTLVQQRTDLQNALKHTRTASVDPPSEGPALLESNAAAVLDSQCDPLLAMAPSAFTQNHDVASSIAVRPTWDSVFSENQCTNAGQSELEKQVAGLMNTVRHLQEQVQTHEEKFTVMAAENTAAKRKAKTATPNVSTVKVSGVNGEPEIKAASSASQTVAHTYPLANDPYLQILSTLPNSHAHAMQSGATAATATTVAFERLRMLQEVTWTACSITTTAHKGFLHLAHCNITDTEVERICEEVRLQELDENFCLRELNLRGNRITNVGARHVAALLSIPMLTRVDLRENSLSATFGDEWFSAFAAAKRGKFVQCENGMVICSEDYEGKLPVCTVIIC